MSTATGAVAQPASVPPSLDDAFDIMLVGWSFMRANLLMSALELGVFEDLAKEPGTARQLTRRLGLHERGARDFLDALSALGLLERDGDTYSNGPAADRYLVPGRPGFVGGFLAMTTGFTGAGWDRLTTTLRTGRPHGQEAGSVPFEQVFRDPDRLRQFLSAMDSLNGTIGPELSRRYDWSRHSTFVDVGGARGNLACTLLLAHPHLEGAVFDRPVMGPYLEELAKQRGVRERITFHGGDFNLDAIPAADVVLFGNVLHDCPVETRRRLITQAAETIPPGGAVLVYDPMIDDARSIVDNMLLSLIMMVQSPAGNEYTSTDCRAWMEQAGLQVEEVLRLPAHATAVLGRKPV